MIDSHTHIYAVEFAEDLSESIERAQAAGVSKLLLPNIDVDSISAVNQVVKDYPSYAYKMMGLHPCSVGEDFKTQLSAIKNELDKGDSIAVGEIGIDLYWDKSTKDIQIEAFLEQCEWAIAADLPIVIHSRESIDLILELIELHFTGRVKGVFHCFTGNLDQAKRIEKLGMYYGIGGVLTFKNSDLKNILTDLPLDFLMLETDAPYLAPVPYRGKRNEPSYLAEVLNYMSGILELPAKELDSILEANTKKLFNI